MVGILDTSSLIVKGDKMSGNTKERERVRERELCVHVCICITIDVVYVRVCKVDVVVFFRTIHMSRFISTRYKCKVSTRLSSNPSTGFD